jgi:hypothetical protein
MKKLILAFGFIFMAGASVQAQDNITTPSTTTVTVGPVVNFGHSFTSNMNGNVWKPAGGLGVAVMMMKENWGVGATLAASHEGYKRQYHANGGEFRETIDPTYVRFTPAFYLTPGHFTTHVKPMIYLGPSIARRVAEDHYMSDINVHEQDNEHFVDNGRFKDWDLGAVGGLGVSAQVGANTYFNFSGSYYHGFFDVMNGNENRNVMLNFGLMFGL